MSTIDGYWLFFGTPAVARGRSVRFVVFLQPSGGALIGCARNRKSFRHMASGGEVPKTYYNYLAVYEACVPYTCAEVFRILNLSDDDYYAPSSDLVNHVLRWVVTAFIARFEKLQWRLDMIEKVRNTIASQYKDTRPFSSSSSDGDDEAPMLPADVRARACRQLAATRTDNQCKDTCY